MPLVGFLMDTTLASGAPGVRRRARSLPAHQVGAGPPGRRDSLSGRAARPRLRGLRRVPQEHLEAADRRTCKQFYYDTVNFDPDALMLAVQFAGADHILAGSDYPHQIGSIQKMKAALEQPAAARRSEGRHPRRQRQACLRPVGARARVSPVRIDFSATPRSRPTLCGRRPTRGSPSARAHPGHRLGHLVGHRPRRDDRPGDHRLGHLRAPGRLPAAPAQRLARPDGRAGGDRARAWAWRPARPAWTTPGATRCWSTTRSARARRPRRSSSC